MAIDEKLRAFGNAHGVSVPPSDPSQAPSALVVGEAAFCLNPASFEAAVVLLNAIGVLAMPVAMGRSTGWLASSLGLHDTARRLGEALIREVTETEAREVFVMSPADRWAIEHVYGDRLGLEWPATVPVRDVTSLLAEALGDGRLRLQPPPGMTPPYAYHDPCHTPRLARDHAAPRALLAAALGAESARALFWREGRAHPCGATGGLDFTHPDIAGALAAARVADARAAGAEWLITDDVACEAHLRASAGGLEVRGLYELLAQRVQEL
jgi:Fe-S oxidoreductase